MPLIEEVLRAAASQRPDELLVVDSGSTDGTVQAARRAGASVLEIDPASFGHGRTRNLAVESVTSDIVCFLTQDATPTDGWMAAYREVFADNPSVASAFGPHLPRPDTSPMIARELIDFFGPFSPDGRVKVHRRTDEPGWHPEFLSNANAAYRRSVLLELPFRDIGYAEDRAFAQDAYAAGWSKAYAPKAAVVHAHDYPWLTFMRRYFDEYRGLRETSGYRMSFYPRGLIRDTLGETRADVGWLRQLGAEAGTRRRWLLRSLLHHGGRRTAGLVAGRSERLPASLQRLISLERRATTTLPSPTVASPTPIAAEIESAVVPTRFIGPSPYATPYEVVSAVELHGIVPLDPQRRVPPDTPSLDIAVIVPGFRPGSGGHSTIFTLIEQLERFGHRCSIWLHDPHGMHLRQRSADLRHEIHHHFRHLSAPVHVGFAEWTGSNVVVATGWDTVFAAERLPLSGARAYLIQDHEPEFFATSAERLWADQTYQRGFHPICASRWLAQLMERKHNVTATAFDLGVEHNVYHPHPAVQRRPDTVAFYARTATPRRAGALAIMALEELIRRQPSVRVVSFGSDQPLKLAFPHQHAGVLSPRDLARLYAEATVGLTLSLTNYSLVPQEMMACGLPCVDLAGFSSETAYGDPLPLDLANPSVPDLASALERLIVDRAHWMQRSTDGQTFVARHTWQNAARRVESGLRAALE